MQVCSNDESRSPIDWWVYRSPAGRLFNGSKGLRFDWWVPWSPAVRWVPRSSAVRWVPRSPAVRWVSRSPAVRWVLPVSGCSMGALVSGCSMGTPGLRLFDGCPRSPADSMGTPVSGCLMGLYSIGLQLIYRSRSGTVDSRYFGHVGAYGRLLHGLALSSF